MKKTTRNILIMLAVLVVLGGAAAALLLTQPKTGEEDGPSSQAPVSSQVRETVLDKEAADVASVTVENSLGSFEIAAAESSDEEPAFTLKGYEDYELDASSLLSTVKSLVPLTASKTLGEKDNLEDYGLSGEAAVPVTVRYKDGTEDKLILGNEGGESYGRYVLADGAVYLVSSISDTLFGSMYDYFNSELYTVSDRVKEVTDKEGNPQEEVMADQLDNAVLSGTNFPEPISIKYDSSRISSYMITDPVKAESGTAKFNEMVTALKTPSATGVAAAGLTEETLAEFGLDEPFARIEYSLNGEKHTLAVSDADSEGNRFLTADDRDLVYKAAADTVAAWAETSLMQLRMSYVYLPDIQSVKNLTMTPGGDMVYSFDVTRTKNEEKSTETKVNYDLTLKNAGGKDIEYTNYQAFYQQLIAISVLSMDKAEYGGAPACRVEFTYFEGQKPDVIEYYAVGTDRYAAVLNGEFNGLVRKDDVDRVTSLLPDLNDGKTIEKRT